MNSFSYSMITRPPAVQMKSHPHPFRYISTLSSGSVSLLWRGGIQVRRQLKDIWNEIYPEQSNSHLSHWQAYSVCYVKIVVFVSGHSTQSFFSPAVSCMRSLSGKIKPAYLLELPQPHHMSNLIFTSPPFFHSDRDYICLPHSCRSWTKGWLPHGISCIDSCGYFIWRCIIHHVREFERVCCSDLNLVVSRCQCYVDSCVSLIPPVVSLSLFGLSGDGCPFPWRSLPRLRCFYHRIWSLISFE